MKKYACTDPRRQTYALGSGWKTKVYEFILAKGEEGANRREIADGVHLNVGRVSSYLAELKRDGWVKRLGDQVDPSSLSPEDATLFALNALENALVSNASKYGVTDEMNRAFARYQKCKALAIGRGTTANEAKTAMRMALIDIVKLLW